MSVDFNQRVEEIVKKDPRYQFDAYEFVMEALWFTQRKRVRKDHVTGKELLEGIRELGIENYGPLAKTVFEHWGVKSTEDFGEIVFNMVEHALLSKTDTDSRGDFKNVYDFNKAFDIESIL